MTSSATMLADTEEIVSAPNDPSDVAEIKSMVVSPDDVFAAPTAVINFATRRVAYVLWRLGQVPLLRPLMVTLENDHGDVVVSNEELRIWGSGRDKFEALSDFASTFASLMKSYETTADDELSVDALKYRARLRAFAAQ